MPTRSLFHTNSEDIHPGGRPSPRKSSNTLGPIATRHSKLEFQGETIPKVSEVY